MSEKNIGASVHAKLKNLSRERGVDMMSLLRRYAQERLLYRLSVSEEATNFCIKGGVLLSAYNNGDLLRPTEDIDFNGFDENADINTIAEALKVILNTSVEDDGVQFALETMSVKKDRVGIIPGGKIALQAIVHSARVDIRVDVGFGNPVSPAVRKIVMPTLLEGVAPQPEVLAYPLETVIAEKVHAMVQFGASNTRVKDYFDVWMLMKTHSFNGQDLVDAFIATFKAQERDFPVVPIEGLTDDFVDEQESAWKAFLKRIDHREKLGLEQVVEEIGELVHPILEAASNNREFNQMWEAPEGWQGSNQSMRFS